MRINSNIERLVNDIVDGFKNELDYEKVYSIVETLINDGSYTLSELWEINNNDSTEMYHILAMNGDFHKEPKEVNKYRDLSPEEKWEITDNLTSQDIMNGIVDHYLNDNAFWRDIEYEHPDLISFLDNRLAIINKKYGLEKLHQLSKKHPNKKLQQAIMWYNNENTNENKNMAKIKIRITENELKQIVNESVKKVLNENQYGIVTETPEINQLWNELMTLKNGLLKKVLLKYGWGKCDEIGGKFAVRQLRAISEAIGTFNAILQGTTADNEEYWSRIEHEQD